MIFANFFDLDPGLEREDAGNKGVVSKIQQANIDNYPVMLSHRFVSN